jgi:hypothetical protein
MWLNPRFFFGGRLRTAATVRVEIPTESERFPTLHLLRDKRGCVDKSADDVHISTYVEGGVHTGQDAQRIRLFQFNYIAGYSPFTISGIENAFLVAKEKNQCLNTLIPQTRPEKITPAPPQLPGKLARKRG